MLEARRSHRWTRVGVRHTSLTGLGRFMYELRLSQGVRYRVRAVYEGAPGFAPSRSSFRQIAPRLR